MNQKFQAAITQKDDVCYVKLSGVIDEDNSLGTLVEQIPAGTAIINVGEVERINSCGVRDWVNWLGKVEKNNGSVILVECSPAIVAQINLVHNFTGGGAVKSFFAPYFCPACDLEKVLLIDADLRRPKIAKLIGRDPRSPGLADLVAGQAQISQCLIHHEKAGIHILPAGTVPRTLSRRLPGRRATVMSSSPSCGAVATAASISTPLIVHGRVEAGGSE